MAAVHHITPVQSAVDMSKALPVVFNILEKWHCTQDEQKLLLGVASRTTLNKYRSAKGGLNLSRDLLERMSYILNMHKALRKLFTRDDSVYEWVRKPNAHPFFAGQSAMDVMLNGRVADLYEVSRRLTAFCGGQS